MTNTGIVRQLDKLGRITLPMELRRSLGFAERETLSIYTEHDKIILKKYCESDLIEFEGKMVSRKSIEKLSKLAGLI